MTDTTPSPTEPALFSREWLERSLAAQQQEAEKAYAVWQQNLGALSIMQAQLQLLTQQEEKATNGRNDAT